MAINMVRWGILGAGSVARRRVIPALQAHPQCHLQALMVRDLHRAQELAAEFGAEHACDRVDDLLADPQVDAVYISSPVHLHCEHVLAAAAQGKHIFCEKPMALTPDQCRQMIAACQDADVHLEVCFVLRGWPIYQQIKQILDQGRLGHLIELRAHLGKWMPRQKGEWRLDPKQGGGGALVDFGSHYLDLFRYLVGDFARIACMGSSALFAWEVEESAFALIEFKSGAHATLGASCTMPHSGNVLEIYGSEGTLLLGEKLRLLTNAGEEVLPAEFPDYYSGLLNNFCRCVTAGGAPLASGLDGLRNTEAIATAYLSLQQGHILEVS
jgi:predicted dehydrogenase